MSDVQSEVLAALAEGLPQGSVVTTTTSSRPYSVDRAMYCPVGKALALVHARVDRPTCST